MGKIYTPPFAIRYYDQHGQHVAAWEHRTGNPWRGLGRPNDARAEQWRQEMNRSFQPRGSNWHISQARGIVPHIHAVRVYRQSTGETVATAHAPAFEVA